MQNHIKSETVADNSKSTAIVNPNSVRYGDKNAVALMLGMSRRSVDNFLQEGCPHLKLGSRRVRFDMEEVRIWLKEQYGLRRRGRIIKSQTGGQQCEQAALN